MAIWLTKLILLEIRDIGTCGDAAEEIKVVSCTFVMAVVSYSLIHIQDNPSLVRGTREYFQ